MPCTFSKVVRPEKLAAHLFEVDEDVEKDEVSPKVTKFYMHFEAVSPFVF